MNKEPENKIGLDNIVNDSKSNLRWLIIRFFVAIILLVAAGLKAHQLATTPSLGEGLLHARWFNILVVGGELLFGLWLLFGLLSRLTWLAAVILFLIFTVVSLFKAINGETSCGCFGAATVHPWITAIFDIGVVGVLVYFRPIASLSFSVFLNEVLNYKRYCEALANRRFFIVVLLWIILTCPIIWFCSSFKTATIGATGELEFASKNITLEPDKWIGFKFPLLPFLDKVTVDQLTTGQKKVVLLRFDCEDCKVLVEGILDKEQYIFITIPSEKNNVDKFTVPKYSILSDRYEWWVGTPFVFTLDDGIVKKVSRRIE
jgi:uncharacterized membrane protein YphA (DoxX/SURF4 family)